MNPDENEEELIGELADAVIKNLKSNVSEEIDPFDLYANKVHARLHANPQEFRSRLVKGYQALKDESKE